MTDRRVIKKKVALGIIVLLLASRKYAVTNQRGSCARKINKCRPENREFHSLVQNLRSEDPHLHKKYFKDERKIDGKNFFQDFFGQKSLHKISLEKKNNSCERLSCAINLSAREV